MMPGDLLIPILCVVLLFQVFMMYVMYRRIAQQQNEIDYMKGKIELTDADFDLLYTACRGVKSLR